MGENWSGEATRGGVFRLDEQSVYVTIGDNAVVKKGVRKEDPKWMRESTIDNEAATSTNDNIAGPAIIDEVKLDSIIPIKVKSYE
jgi:hypothetical protein